MKLKYFHNYRKVFFIILISLYLLGCDEPSDNDSDKEEKHYIYYFSGTYDLIRVPVPNTGIDFPIGIDDDDTARIEMAFYIGETLITKALWNTVSEWAVEKEYGYYYGLPVYWTTDPNKIAGDYPRTDTTASGYNSVYDYVGRIPMYFVVPIWCNAFTQWYNEKHGTNLVPVYQDSHGNPIRYLNNMDNVFETANPDATGFRLPTPEEWELAARWNGDSEINTVTKHINGIDFSIQELKFTTGRSVSGGKNQVVNFSENDRFAVWKNNSRTVAPVKTKEPNMLGIYDMSGNVLELTSSWKFGRVSHAEYYSPQCRGGSVTSDYEDIAVGKIFWATYNRGSFYSLVETENVGFRVVRNAE